MQFYLIENSAHLRSHTCPSRVLLIWIPSCEIFASRFRLRWTGETTKFIFIIFFEILLKYNKNQNPESNSIKSLHSASEETECINWNACWAKANSIGAITCGFADAHRMHLGDDKSVSRRKSASELMAIKLCAKCVVKFNETQWQDISWRPTACMIKSRRRLFRSRFSAFAFICICWK